MNIKVFYNVNLDGYMFLIHFIISINKIFLEYFPFLYLIIYPQKDNEDKI